MRVRFANSATVEVDQFVKVCVKFSGISKFLKFTVLECECPAILGMDFLRSTNPVVDWVSGKVQFGKREQKPSCSYADMNVFAGLEVANVSEGNKRSISSTFGPHSVGTPMG